MQNKIKLAKTEEEKLDDKNIFSIAYKKSTTAKSK